MGPVLMLDKSAFQSLSKAEHLFMRKHFKVTNAPILVFEVLGDLTKPDKRRPAPQVVADLAEKFGGSGGPYNMHHWTLLTNDLLGAEIPMTGQIIPDNGRQVGSGFMIDISPLGHAIMRWARGDFKAFEEQASKSWRSMSQSLSFSALEKVLRDAHVIIPEVKTPEDLRRVVEELIDSPSLQGVWLEWIVRQAPMTDAMRSNVRSRWEAVGRPFLRHFAPYARHCAKAMLALVAAVHHRLLKWDPTHALDIVYLFYLPFCQAFASGDKVHTLIAPILIRPDQTFIHRDELKKDLKRLIAQWDSLDEPAKRRQSFALGSYPAPAVDSVVTKVWEKQCIPWNRPQSLLGNLTEEEVTLAIEEAHELYRRYREAGGPPQAEGGTQ